MKIEKFSFGNISVGGKIYTSDLIICPSTIIYPWRRQEGHVLQLEDLKDIIEITHDVLIIGTGIYGRMNVPEITMRSLHRLGITIHVNITPEAVDLFNMISGYKKTIACLHLSC